MAALSAPRVRALEPDECTPSRIKEGDARFTGTTWCVPTLFAGIVDTSGTPHARARARARVIRARRRAVALAGEQGARANSKPTPTFTGKKQCLAVYDFAGDAGAS